MFGSSIRLDRRKRIKLYTLCIMYITHVLYYVITRRIRVRVLQVFRWGGRYNSPGPVICYCYS